MITEEQLWELEVHGVGCTRQDLRWLARFLNESGSAKAAHVDVVRTICGYARGQRVEVFEFLLNRDRYLAERQQLYQLQIDKKLMSQTSMEPHLRDLQTLKDALADVQRAYIDRRLGEGPPVQTG